MCPKILILAEKKPLKIVRMERAVYGQSFPKSGMVAKQGHFSNQISEKNGALFCLASEVTMLVKEFIEELQKLPQDIPVMYDDKTSGGLELAAIYHGEIQLPPEVQKDLGEKSYDCVIVHSEGGYPGLTEEEFEQFEASNLRGKQPKENLPGILSRTANALCVSGCTKAEIRLALLSLCGVPVRPVSTAHIQIF